MHGSSFRGPVIIFEDSYLHEKYMFRTRAIRLESVADKVPLNGSCDPHSTCSCKRATVYCGPV